MNKEIEELLKSTRFNHLLSSEVRKQIDTFVIQKTAIFANKDKVISNALIYGDTDDHTLTAGLYLLSKLVEANPMNREHVVMYGDVKKMNLNQLVKPFILVLQPSDLTNKDEVLPKLSFFFENPECTLIVCSKEDKIIECFYDDRIYYDLLSEHIKISETNVDDVYNSFIEKLSSAPYKCTDEFKEGIKEYISVIYTDARMKENDFVNDLYNRVMRNAYKKEHCTHIEATDIPYSTKLIEKKKTKKQEKPEQYNIITKLGKTVGTKSKNKPINILITNVSTVNPTLEEHYYKDVEDNNFIGIATNEAPIKSIMYRLSKDEDYLDRILFIESEKVRTSYVANSNITHSLYLENTIRQFVEDESMLPILEHIEIKNEPDNKDVAEAVFQIYNKLKDIATKEEGRNINIYIESNGGVRYVLTMLLSLTKTLENFYANIHIIEVTSMIINKTTIISNTKSVYDTTQIAGIADEFVHYGRTNSLQRYISTYVSELNEIQKSDTYKILKILNKVSDDIQLCRTTAILEDFYSENNFKRTVNEFCDKYTITNPEAATIEECPAIIQILVNILQLIIDEMDKTIYKDVSLNISEPIMYLPNIIEWCLNKSFIQQALTLVAERLANYLFATKQITLCDSLNEILNNTDTKHYDKQYYFIANFSRFVDIENGALANSVLAQLKTKDRNNIVNWDELSISTSSFTLKYSLSDDNINKLLNAIELINADDANIVNKYNNLGIDTNLKLDISNNNKAKLKHALLGQYVNNNNQIVTHTNLDSKKKRIEKILPALIKYMISKELKNQYNICFNMYGHLIEEIFDVSETSTNLKKKYQRDQSSKYFIRTDADNNNIYSPSNNLQKILYIYSICKEQRNFSNHANVSEDDQNVALKSEDIKKVIIALLNVCTSEVTTFSDISASNNAQANMCTDENTNMYEDDNDISSMNISDLAERIAVPAPTQALAESIDCDKLIKLIKLITAYFVNKGESNTYQWENMSKEIGDILPTKTDIQPNVNQRQSCLKLVIKYYNHLFTIEQSNTTTNIITIDEDYKNSVMNSLQHT